MHDDPDLIIEWLGTPEGERWLSLAFHRTRDPGLFKITDPPAGPGMWTFTEEDERAAAS